MSQKKQLAALPLLLLFASCVFAGCGKAEAASAGNTAAKPVTRGDLVVGLTADGTVALPVTNLSFEVEGTVASMLVATGMAVGKGDLLAELDDADYRLAIETAENNLKKAQTNYGDALWNYEHNLKGDKQSLDLAALSLSEGFDAYDYELSIADAKRSLEKRKRSSPRRRPTPPQATATPPCSGRSTTRKRSSPKSRTPTTRPCGCIAPGKAYRTRRTGSKPRKSHWTPRN